MARDGPPPPAAGPDAAVAGGARAGIESAASKGQPVAHAVVLTASQAAALARAEALAAELADLVAEMRERSAPTAVRPRAVAVVEPDETLAPGELRAAFAAAAAARPRRRPRHLLG